MQKEVSKLQWFEISHQKNSQKQSYNRSKEGTSGQVWADHFVKCQIIAILWDCSQSPPKEYKCICGKIYKTSHGLKNHKNIHHNNNQTTPQKQSQSQAQTQTSGPLPVSIPIATQTQSSTPVQTQTTQTTSVQTNTTIIGKSPVINGQTLSPVTKESILATFVRCRPIQTLPTNGTATGVQTRIDGLPLMLTLQTDDSKNTESDSVTNDKKILINGSGVKKCPAIAAPTLQQHLLSPLVGKSTISVTKIL